MKRTNFREVYGSSIGGLALPELSMVGWRRLSKTDQPGLPAHRHSDRFEFFLIERGEVEWWVEQEVHRVPAGHVYLNRPGEVHGSVGAGLKPCGYFWIIIRADLPGLDASTASELRAQLEQLTQRSFPGSVALREAFRRLWELHRHPPAVLPFMAMRAQLHLLLTQLLADHRSMVTRRSAPSYAIRRALNAIETRLPEIRTLAELARVAGLGVTQFSERFLADTGSTPAMYLRQRRVARARQLLSEGRLTVARVAQEVGFSSGQNFATTFRELEGVTPTGFILRERAARRQGGTAYIPDRAAPLEWS